MLLKKNGREDSSSLPATPDFYQKIQKSSSCSASFGKAMILPELSIRYEGALLNVFGDPNDTMRSKF